MQQHTDLRIAFGKALEHGRQHVARLKVRGRDGQRSRVFALELGADATQVIELLQRPPRRRDDDLAAGGQRREALALANENRHAELIFELTDLLADPRLRREQRLCRGGDVEAMIDDRTEVAQLLQVQGSLGIDWTSEEAQII